MRVALVHDWLTGMRGGEKALEVLCELFPEADIFTLVHLPGKVSPAIERHRIFTSFLQHVPRIDRYYRHLLPLMPWAIERFNLEAYDFVISSSHCVAKGVRTRDTTRHVCYCYTPMRYIWDQFDEYFGPDKSSFFVRLAMQWCRPRLQRWDQKTASNVGRFIAISRNVQERIKRIYGRESDLIYPPVDYEFYAGGGEQSRDTTKQPFYLIVSALAPYKRVDLAIEAFKRLGKKLVVIGEGQDSARLKALSGPDIEFLGWRSNEELRSFYRKARALIFPGLEDFGIVPLEAMSAGCPVIAYGKGGALETVKDPSTGLFFTPQTAEALISTLQRFETLSFDSAAIRRHAAPFSRAACMEAFRQAFMEYRVEMS